jgi:class 3 adenylate cyclase
MTASSTVTVAFTDVVRSTELRTGKGDAPAHQVMKAHFGEIRRQIQEYDGREVKTMGDGFMVAFSSARNAADWAVHVQRAIAKQEMPGPEEQVEIRIGINTGEAIPEGDDLFGSAVVAAQRITSKAKGGQILVSEIVRGVVGAMADFEFVDKGRFRLKGFPQRWRLFEVLWRPGAAAPSRRVLTFLFTDVEGFSAVSERLPEEQWVDLLRAHNAIVRAELAANSAFAVKSLGDGFMVAFQSPEKALQCAIDIQDGFASYNAEHVAEPINVRIALNTGEVIEEGDDFYGTAVVSAARLANLARGQEILVTTATKELAKAKGFVFEDRGEQSLRGVGAPVRVWAVRPE